MKPENPEVTPQNALFWVELINMIDRRRGLVRLAEIIDRDAIDEGFGESYIDRKGRPGIPTRLMAGLLYLKHTLKLSDEDVVRRWVPIIGHMKADGHRNWVKGSLGDPIHAQLCGAVQNQRMILKKLRLRIAWISGQFEDGLAPNSGLLKLLLKRLTPSGRQRVPALMPSGS